MQFKYLIIINFLLLFIDDYVGEIDVHMIALLKDMIKSLGLMHIMTFCTLLHKFVTDFVCRCDWFCLFFCQMVICHTFCLC